MVLKRDTGGGHDLMLKFAGDAESILPLYHAVFGRLSMILVVHVVDLRRAIALHLIFAVHVPTSGLCSRRRRFCSTVQSTPS